MNIMVRRAMQEAAIPASLEVHRAAAAAALAPSLVLPEDRRSAHDALVRAGAVTKLSRCMFFVRGVRRAFS